MRSYILSVLTLVVLIVSLLVSTGGTYTAGTPMHLILIIDDARIRINAEIY